MSRPHLWLALLGGPAITHLLTAWALWEFNPGYWSDGERLTCVIAAVALSLMIFAHGEERR